MRRWLAKSVTAPADNAKSVTAPADNRGGTRGFEGHCSRVSTIGSEPRTSLAPLLRPRCAHTP